MNQRVLISGSIAYDTIMVFDGHFKDHILPDRTHMLSVSFLVPRLTRQYGGTGANIAYNVSMLGGDAAVLATVGRDGDEYIARLGDMGIDTQAVRRLDAHWTAQCFITTDLANNQLIAFHPGAMDDAHAVGLTDARPAVLGIVSPNGKQAMLDHARQFEQAGMRWIFDPGQGLPMFDGNELRDLIGRASAVAVNDYECAMLVQKTGWDEARIAASLQALIVTRGAEGSVAPADRGSAPCDVTARTVRRPRATAGRPPSRQRGR